jgi:hypothetical protein
MNYVKLSAQLHIFCPTSVSLKLLNLPEETTYYNMGGGVSPRPTSFGPDNNLQLVFKRVRRQQNLDIYP